MIIVTITGIIAMIGVQRSRPWYWHLSPAAPAGDKSAGDSDLSPAAPAGDSDTVLALIRAGDSDGRRPSRGWQH